MDTIRTCPLGSVCEEIKDNKLHRCMWFVEMNGLDISGNEHKSSKCTFEWMPILLTEVSGTNRGQTAALESMRNESSTRQTEAIDMMIGLANARTIESK